MKPRRVRLRMASSRSISRSRIFSAYWAAWSLRDFFSAAVKLRSSVRLMRLWAYMPSRRNSAALTADSGLDFALISSGESFSKRPWICFSSSREPLGGLCVVELDGAAEVEPLLDLLRVGIGEVLVEDVGHAGADDLANDGVGAAHLAFVFELDLAADAGERGVDVADAGNDERFVVEERAAFGVRDDEFHGADGEALRDAAALVDFLVFAGGEGDLLDDLADVVGDLDVARLGAWTRLPAR